MSTKYKHGDTVPSDALCQRLQELSNFVTKGPDTVAREFTMRVPAEPDRDADLVLSDAAARITELEASNARLKEYVRIADRSLRHERADKADLKGEVQQLKSALVGVVWQYACEGEDDKGEYFWHQGISAMEAAFDALGAGDRFYKSELLAATEEEQTDEPS